MAAGSDNLVSPQGPPGQGQMVEPKLKKEKKKLVSEGGGEENDDGEVETIYNK